MPKSTLTAEILKRDNWSKRTIQLFQNHYPNGITKWNLEEQIKLLKTPLRMYLGGFWRDRLLKNISMVRADLSGLDLTDADLSNANLTEANLTGADLKYAHLIKANLTKTNLTGANLRYCYFYNTIFHKTILTNAKLNPKDFYKYFLKK